MKSESKKRLLKLPFLGAVAAGVSASAGAADSSPAVKVTSSAIFAKDMPLENAIDGDPRTVAWPWELSRIYDDSEFREARNDRRTTDYEFHFIKPCKINRVRFWQHPLSFATSYRILANTSGEKGQWDKVLVDLVRADPCIPTDRWIEHEFDPVEVHALRFQPLGTVRSSVELNISNPPALREFEAYLSDAPRTMPGAQPAEVSVDPTRRWVVNGHSEIRRTMFSLPNLGGDDAFIDQYIKPLNLGMITFWDEGFKWAPEDPKCPGAFDRSSFEPGGGFDGKLYDTGGAKERFRIAGRIGAEVNLKADKSPDYMRRYDFHPTEAPAAWRQQNFPPKDPVEWGDLVAHMVRGYNLRSDGLIKWVHLWNEPNTTAYWPLPWRDKPRTFRDLHGKAAPVIKRMNPQVRVGGPVLSGGGVLGWADLPKPNELPGLQDYGRQRALTWSQLPIASEPADEYYWKQWIKGMVDECGDSLDFLDVHCYETDLMALQAETRLFANYCSLKLGHVVPLLVSEANPNLYVDAENSDPTTVRWRVVAVSWADQLMGLLDMPDKFEGVSYFYTWPWGQVGIFDENQSPNPVYWVYWVMRNARGQRLWSVTDDENLRVLACRQDQRINILALNRGSEARDLQLAMPSAMTLEGALDYLECNPATGQAEHGSRQELMKDGRLAVAMKPFGLYSFTASLPPDASSDLQSSATETEYYGDRVWQELARDGQSVSFHVAIPEGFKKTERALLRFGTCGIPYSRPRTVVDMRVPLEVEINGRRHGPMLAGKDNAIELETEDLRPDNLIVFRRAGADAVHDGRIVDPPRLVILSASLVLAERDENRDDQ